MNTTQPEARIIARGLRRRDPELLDRLIEQYGQRLLRYLIYLAGTRELADDLFQETWVRVMERGRQYNGEHSFSTWLYTVARNLTIDHLRKRHPVSLDRLMEGDDHLAFEPVDTGPSAWQLVAQHEQTARISAALTQLPAAYREAIALRFLDGLALEEIAVVTAAPLGTVKSRVYRGLSLLMAMLKENRI